MNLVEIIAELQKERAAIEEALSYLQPLVAGGNKFKSRALKLDGLPKAKSDGSSPTRKRRPFSAATRAKMAASQKARWAAARAGSSPT